MNYHKQTDKPANASYTAKNTLDKFATSIMPNATDKFVANEFATIQTPSVSCVNEFTNKFTTTQTQNISNTAKSNANEFTDKFTTMHILNISCVNKFAVNDFVEKFTTTKTPSVSCVNEFTNKFANTNISGIPYADKHTANRTAISRPLLSFLLASTLLLLATPTAAQTQLPADIARLLTAKTLPNPNTQILRDKQEQIYNKFQQKPNQIDLSQLMQTKNITTPKASKTPQPCFQIENISLKANTVLKETSVSDITRKYITGKRACLTLPLIQNLQDELNNLYIKEGYITSQAVLVPQDIRASLKII